MLPALVVQRAGEDVSLLLSGPDVAEFWRIVDEAAKWLARDVA